MFEKDNYKYLHNHSRVDLGVIFKNDIFHKKKILYIALISLYIALIADTSIHVLSDIIFEFSVSAYGIWLFIAIGIIFVIAPFIILNHPYFPKEIGILMAKRYSPHFQIQFEHIVLTVVMVVIIFQILMFFNYHKVELMIASAISYGTATILMIILAVRLFRWFLMGKNIVTFFFGVASVLIATNALVSLVYFEYVIAIEREIDIITPSIIVLFETHFADGSFMYYISLIQLYSMAGYFVVTWGATLLLLIHHAKRVGYLRFGLMVVLPIFVFIYFYAILFDSAIPNNPVTQATPLEAWSFWLSYDYAAALIGIIIGIGFYSVARSVRENKNARDSLIIAGYGFIFYFISAFATVIQTGYPPFGLANVSFVGIASFMIFTGLYNSAVSVSRDVELRSIIRKSLLHQSRFLSSMGLAQNRHELEKNILELSKLKSEEISKSNNIYPSISENEIKDYVNEVLEEVIKSKKKVEK